MWHFGSMIVFPVTGRVALAYDPGEYFQQLDDSIALLIETITTQE